MKKILFLRNYKGTCPTCGGIKSRHAKQCADCSGIKNNQYKSPKFADALELYLQGATWKKIGGVLGISAERARQIFSRRRDKYDFVLGVYVGMKKYSSWQLRDWEKFHKGLQKPSEEEYCS